MNTFNPQISNRLISLESRIRVAEIQLQAVEDQLEAKRQLWAKVRSELADMVLFFTVAALTLLLLNHYF